MRLRLKIISKIRQEMASLDFRTALIAFKKISVGEKLGVRLCKKRFFSTTGVRKLECQQKGVVMSERMVRIFSFLGEFVNEKGGRKFFCGRNGGRTD